MSSQAQLAADVVVDEILCLARYQGISSRAVESALADIKPHLSAYAEITLTEHGFEVITGGVGTQKAHHLADIAVRHGAPRRTIDTFLRGDQRFPGSNLGLKLCFGEDARSPSLYIRSRCSVRSGLAFLATVDEVAPALDELQILLASNDVLYGLGFFGWDADLAVKTYTLGLVPARASLDWKGESSAPGFLSYRIHQGRIVDERKRYLPDLDWDDVQVPTPRWRELHAFARLELGYDRIGHFAVTEEAGVSPVLKLYVERIGAIPTEFDAT